MDYLTVMAEAVQQDINSSLLLVEEMYASKSLLNDLTKLKEYVERIHALLLDGEIVRSEDRFEYLQEVRKKEIRRFLYDTDNFLDTINYRRQLSLGCFRVKSLWKTRKAPTISVTFRGDNPTYEAGNTSQLTRLTENEVREATISYVDPDSIFGRDRDKDAIIQMLLLDTQGQDRRERVSVIPIIGMAGIGKTTVAQLLFNDVIIRQHFDPRLWVWVGPESNLFNILLNIINCVTEKRRSHYLHLEQVQNDFLKAISGKRFFLVLDEVWTFHPIIWQRIKNLLSAGGEGSKVILTTRSQEVAYSLGTFLPYKMEPLSDDHAWSLFKLTAFDSEGIENLDLQDIGREILKKIGKATLKIKTIASLLYRQSREKWIMVMNMSESELLQFADSDKVGYIPRFHDRAKRNESETCSYVDASTIIGRDTDDDAITKMLLSDDHGEEIVVIPITGMAMVGKTALVQLVYNNPDNVEHFDLRSWIWVGLEFNLSSMMKKVVEQWTSKNESTDLEQLQILFLEKIQNKRYLLVLDDVCVIDRNVWLNFKYLLKASAPGSKVILTTRSEQVASTIGTVNSYELKPLSGDHALSLFTSLAFSPGQDVEKTEVIDISKKILEKIGNVPLTIMTVGNLLHHQDISKWEELASCMEVPRFTQIVPILERTYDQLPSSIKRCFAYCAIFPKGYTIDKRRLIQLWIAQGFVQLPLDDPNQSYEDTAENHFMELQSWFFFKNVISRDEQGNISFIMNELEYDLAQYVAAIEIKVLLSRDAIASTIPNEIYHLSVDYSSNLQESDIRTLPKELRSFINVSQSTIHLTSSYCAQLLSHLKYLRALDLHASDLPEIPNSIGSLKHLRYLNLSYNPFKSLPDSLMGLINLQVLDLSCCKKLEKLPRRLRRLKSLRHLYLGDCEKLACMPVGMGQMTSLQTLSHFVLGKGKNSCKLDELGSLNLKAELTIVFANSQ
ncbi:unnamed protein product [Amaranthus hypochondriacus]